MRWCMRGVSKVYAWCMQMPFIWLIFCGQMYEPPKNSLGCNAWISMHYSLNQWLAKNLFSPLLLPAPHMVIIEYQQLIWIGVCEVYAFSVHTYLTGFAEVV